MRKSTRYLLKHPLALFRHPHQGFWNIYTKNKIVRATRTEPLVMAIDTWLLKQRSSPSARVKTGAPLFLDIGTHRDGSEMRRILDWFPGEDIRIIAFEANPRHHAEVVPKFADDPRVEIHNLALVGPDYTEGSIKLFLSGPEGRGDSIFASRGQEAIDVPALRLSRFIADNGIDLANRPVILRMNVEGAEYGILKDLVESGLSREISGYFGMWDDLWKIDPEGDIAFQRFMKAHGIAPITFNGRDIPQPKDTGLRRRILEMRERTIRTHMRKAAGAA